MAHYHGARGYSHSRDQELGCDRGNSTVDSSFGCNKGSAALGSATLRDSQTLPRFFCQSQRDLLRQEGSRALLIPLALFNQTTMASAPVPANNTLNHLLPPNWKTKVTEWLQEDIPSFDYGGYVVGEKETTAILFGKSQVS